MKKLSLVQCLLAPVLALGPADSVMDADLAQTGYLPNHNIDPAIISSSSFGILWTNTFNLKEKWYAKPLTFTPNGSSRQLVFTASSQNWIRTMDALNGTVLNSRQVQLPFLQSDLNCADIPDTIGITGTPVIDPSTEIAYFFSKGYKPGSSSGLANGIYKFYAVYVSNLQDVPGFPVLIDGHPADNDPTKYFLGGVTLQRPSLSIINGVVYGAFGGHCDKFNYTGMIVGVSTAPYVGVTTLYAMESAPYAPAPSLDLQKTGGEAGIWQSGMGLASDGSRIFAVTGNGIGHQNRDTPASGRASLSTLDEVVANFDVSSGKLRLADYFQPWEYIDLDAADRDLGGGGLMLLDPSVFKGAGVARMGVVAGKNGKAYFVNADNLGGYRNGPANKDAIIQTIVLAGAVFAGTASYPLEGGYVYVNPADQKTVAFKLGFDQSGIPVFTQVGQSADNNAGGVGSGPPTITTYKGQAGTALLFVTDPNQGLRIFNAVPQNGVLSRILSPATGGLSKFSRPGFGDGTIFVTDSNSHIIGLGAPVTLPLNCTSPIDFGTVLIGSIKEVTVNCTALVQTTVIGAFTSEVTFQVNNQTLPKAQLNARQNFQFNLTWNLTEDAIRADRDQQFGAGQPGAKAGSLTIITNNAVPKYSNNSPIALIGRSVSSNAFLNVSPMEIDFQPIIVGSPSEQSGITSVFTISNRGQGILRLLGYAYTNNTDHPIYQNVTNGNIGLGFSTDDLPPVNTELAAGDSINVDVLFKSSGIGSYSSVLQFWSDGGNDNILLTGSAASPGKANISVSNASGLFISSAVIDFGNVTMGTAVVRQIRICNSGDSSVTITKSKPPYNGALQAENPALDLHEGLMIVPNSCAFGAIDFAPPAAPPNSSPYTLNDSWVLNVDDITFGVHVVQITGTAISRKLGPTLPDGSPRFKYLGCYFDGAGRLLQQNNNLGTQNENGLCQTTCLQQGYIFAGTEYHQECWCGNTPPTASKYTDPGLNRCTFSCNGDSSQSCGGDGTYMSGYYDSLRYSPGCDSLLCSGSSSTTTTTSSSSISGPISTATVVNPGNVDYQSIGCYKDGASKAIFPNQQLAQDNMTVFVCLNYCKSLNKKFAGIEYRRECYCGDSLALDAVPNANACSLTCMANTTEYCGGANAMNVYQISNSISSIRTMTSTKTTSSTSSTASPTSIGDWNALGCYAEPPNGRLLSQLFANDALTIELCMQTCQQNGYSYAGAEYGRECWCGNMLSSNDPSLILTISACDANCAGNPKEICGGGSKLSLYKLGTMSTSLSLSTSTSSASSSLTTAASSMSIAAPTNGFFSAGCYFEPASGGRLMKQIAARDDLSVELCLSIAKAALPTTTYRYVGVEYGRECYAATSLSAVPTSAVGSKACRVACKGNVQEFCGGALMLNLYVSNSVTFVTPPSTRTTGTVVPTSH